MSKELIETLNPYQLLKTLLVRWRYPVSLPEEIAHALGVSLSNSHTYDDMVSTLSSPSCSTQHLRKFMPRKEAEKHFKSAPQTERFGETSLFGFYFSQGWIEFSLKFDETDRLRRLYLIHKGQSEDHGIEIPLS